MHWAIAILRWLFNPIEEPPPAVDDFDEPRLPKTVPGPFEVDPVRLELGRHRRCRKIRVVRLEPLKKLDDE